MNKSVLIGRLCGDPGVRYSSDGMAIAKVSLAVDRMGKDKGADFIRLVAFDKRAQIFEKYLKKGSKVAVLGHIQTGSYQDKDGKTVYTTDVVVDEIEFCDSKSDAKPSAPKDAPTDGFMNIDMEISEEELPFV